MEIFRYVQFYHATYAFLKITMLYKITQLKPQDFGENSVRGIKLKNLVSNILKKQEFIKNEKKLKKRRKQNVNSQCLETGLLYKEK